MQIIQENDLASWDGLKDEDPNLHYVDGDMGGEIKYTVAANLICQKNARKRCQNLLA